MSDFRKMLIRYSNKVHLFALYEGDEKDLNDKFDALIERDRKLVEALKLIVSCKSVDNPVRIAFDVLKDIGEEI